MGEVIPLNRIHYLRAELTAVGLYVAGSRDLMDFLDMIQEESNPVTLRTLYEMLTTPNPNSNQWRNDLMTGPCERRMRDLGLWDER